MIILETFERITGAANVFLKRKKKIKILIGLFSTKTLLIVFIFFLLVIAIGMFAGSSTNSPSGPISNLNLSETTLQWMDKVSAEAKNQGVPELVPYILAIIEVETRGVGNDIMQSGESLGLGAGSLTPEKSIEQGIKYLKNSMMLGKSLGFTDVWGIIQSYNFGTNYVYYLATEGKIHSVDIAEKYSRDVVAPSLGNYTGETYSYVNAVSQSYGKTYLYRNGGNFFYADLVKQYVTSGVAVGNETFKTIMEEASKYIGWEYVWGGSNPNVGFDCSGLTQWTYSKAGITLPRTAAEQWKATQEVSIEDAQPGDLIFFKGTYGGPQHISHVGIYINETTMFDSNNSGVGYHNWSSGYWMEHFDSIRRVKQ